MNQITKTIGWVLPQKQFITEGERQTPTYLQGKSSKIDVLVHMFFGGCWLACEHGTNWPPLPRKVPRDVSCVLMRSSGQLSQTWTVFCLFLGFGSALPGTTLSPWTLCASAEHSCCWFTGAWVVPEGGGGMGVGKPLFSFGFWFVMGVKARKEVGLCTNFSSSFLVKYSFQFLLKAPCPLLSTTIGLSNWETGLGGNAVIEGVLNSTSYMRTPRGGP